MPLTTFLDGRAPIRQRGLMFTSMSDVAVIQGRTSASDTGGDASAVWNAKGTVACRLYPVSLRGKGALTGERLDERTTHFCAMPLGTDITTSDRIIVNGGTYEVTVALDATSQFATRVEVFQV